jgi:superfamily I DNA/RNA helicase
MIEWTMSDHPHDEVQTALTKPLIEPTLPDDPQANPPDRPDQIHFRSERFKPPQEIQAIVRSVKQWLKQNPTKTVAILDARNKRGVDIANALRRANVPYVELLNSTAATRSTAGVLGNVLKYLARPEDSRQLATVFHVWKRHDWDLEDLQPIFQQVETAIQNCARLEDYLWPRPGHNWLENQAEIILPVEGERRGGEETKRRGDEEASEEWLDAAIEPAESSPHESSPHHLILSLLTGFRELARRWQQAWSMLSARPG